jgi:hypothetical protein
MHVINSRVVTDIIQPLRRSLLHHAGLHRGIEVVAIESFPAMNVINSEPGTQYSLHCSAKVAIGPTPDKDRAGC